jgi:hypothetical protein
MRSGAAFRRGLAFALMVAAAGCIQLVGIPERAPAANLDCTDGNCVCIAGFGDCDHDLTNGCEIDVQSNVENCGACGLKCGPGECIDGTCQCETGYIDCDPESPTICDTHVAVDGKNCGACGAFCEHGSCADGVCTCDSGYTDCGNDPSALCATVLLVDSKNCGTCGHDCLGGGCTNSACLAVTLGAGGFEGPVLAGDSLVGVDSYAGDVYEALAYGDVPEMKVATVPLSQSDNEEISDITSADGLAYMLVSDGNDPAKLSIYVFDPTGQTVKFITSTTQTSQRIFDTLAITSDAYWIEHAEERLIRIDRATLAVTTPTTDIYSRVRVHDDKPYWGDNEDEIVTLAGNGSTTVLWPGDANVDECDAAISSTGGVIYLFDCFSYTLSKWDGTTLTTVPADQVSDFAVGQNDLLYWLAMSQGEVETWDGTTMTTLAAGQSLDSIDSPPPARIVVTDKAIFWHAQELNRLAL